VIENEKMDMPILKIDESAEKEQLESINKIKQMRDNDKVKRALEDLKKAAGNSENTVPHLIECAKCYATEGEITEVLKSVFGEYQEPAWF